jgi:hypothetical protein
MDPVQNIRRHMVREACTRADGGLTPSNGPSTRPDSPTRTPAPTIDMLAQAEALGCAVPHREAMTVLLGVCAGVGGGLIMSRARSPLTAKVRCGDPGGSAAFPVAGPGLGHVEVAVDQGVSAGGGVGGEDADLAIFGASGGAGVRALRAR